MCMENKKEALNAEHGNMCAHLYPKNEGKISEGSEKESSRQLARVTKPLLFYSNEKEI